jgi:lipopolysaccharide export system permease protein
VDPGTNRLWDVSIYDVSNPGVVRSIYADSGRALFNAARTDLVMRLYSGHMREVNLDDPKTFRRMTFREQVFGIPGVGTTLPTGDRGEGYRGDREMTIGMLEARIDTLKKEREGVYRRIQGLADADLRYALSGGADAPPVGAEERALNPVPIQPGMAPPSEGGVPVRTRRTADELESARMRVAELEQQMREYDVEVHKKYSIAVASLVFVIIGAPLALRFGGGGIGMVIATSMIIFALYYIGLIGGEALAGRGYVTPLVAMWVVNALMTVLGVLGLATMGRETSTARSSMWDTMLQAFRDFFATVFRRRARA